MIDELDPGADDRPDTDLHFAADSVLLASTIPIEELIGSGGGEAKGTQRLGMRSSSAAGGSTNSLCLSEIRSARIDDAGTRPATSQLDAPISITAISVRSRSRAARDRLILDRSACAVSIGEAWFDVAWACAPGCSVDWFKIPTIDKILSPRSPHRICCGLR